MILKYIQAIIYIIIFYTIFNEKIFFDISNIHHPRNNYF